TQFEPDIKSLFEHFSTRLYLGERRQSLSEVGRRFDVSSPGERSKTSLARIGDCLVPEFTPERVVRQDVDALVQAIRIEKLQRPSDPSMPLAPSAVKQPLIDDLVRQRMSKGVLELGEEPGFVQELPGLQAGESVANALLRFLGDGLQQREGHVLANYRCRL